MHTSKQDIYQFITDKYHILFKEWERNLKTNINAETHKYSAEGKSSAYFNVISDHMAHSVKNLLADLIDITLNSFSTNKIINFSTKELEEALHQNIYHALDRCDEILNELTNPYRNNLALKNMESKLQENLRNKTIASLLFLLNKFEYDLSCIVRIKTAEKRATRGEIIAGVSIFISFIHATFHWWKNLAEKSWIIITQYFR